LRVLVLGSGAREHTIIWKFAKSKRIAGLFAAPGNAGTAGLAENLSDVDPCNPDDVLKACRKNDINLVFVGPETPLEAGIVDVLQRENIPAIGPHKEAAQLETSKAFSKTFMSRHGIPTALSETVDKLERFKEVIDLHPEDKKLVIKKSGLAAGKGVLESEDKNEMLKFGGKILKQDHLIVEEFLTGYEVSIFSVCDGKNHITLPPCTDFKKAGENDTGPNTGGMGAICPVPWVDTETLDAIAKKVVEPTFCGLAADNLLYKGVVYFGIMVTESGPKVLEYNVRFGDPEAQVLLPLIESDFGNFCDSVAHGKISTFPLRLSSDSAIGIVVASRGYPGSYKKSIRVKPFPPLSAKPVQIFHASTTLSDSGEVLTGGGRCFTVVAQHANPLRARSIAYESVADVQFSGAWHRKDIGSKFYSE
jgi:phosphoribosylamine---glycine ligase